MKRLVFLFVIISLCFNGLAQQWKALGNEVPSEPKVALLSTSDEEINVRFALGGYYDNRVPTPRGTASVVSVPKMASMLEEGCPDLPLYAIPVAISEQAEMEVAVTDAQYEDFYGIEIAPSKGNLSRETNPEDVPYRYGEAYQHDAFFPANQAALDHPYILRDVRGQNILVYPFAYNPVRKVLRVYSGLTLTMRKVGEHGENSKTTHKTLCKMSAETEVMYARRFINYREYASKYTFIPDEGATLVISPGKYMAAMQPYVDWKNQSGRPTVMYSLDEVGGNDDVAIRTFILSHYNNPEENLCYVLLVGDYEDLTPHDMNGGSSDIWFGQLEGSDFYPEIFVGRVSAERVADVEHQVAKFIYYERDMPASATWISKGIGIGSTEGEGSGHNGGESDCQHIEYIRDTLLHYSYSEISQHYAGVGIGTNASMLSENFNAGAGICNYCNHGTPTGWHVGSFNNNHVNALTNDYRWPFIWSTACYNGMFDEDCFAEAWMRAVDDVTGVPTGAIGGMFSWVSQPWQPPMTGQDEMINVLCEWSGADQFHHTFGGASLNGNMKILDLHPTDHGKTHNTWILFGDPSLMLRTATPQRMNVSCTPEAIFLGEGVLHVTADVDYALATLSVDGDVLSSVPIVNGEAMLTFESPLQVGVAQLVVTGFNKVTYVQDIDIIPSTSAYVTYESYVINSENGQADYGETFSINLNVKNIGNVDAANVQAVLSSDSPYVEVLDDTATIPSLAALEQYSIEDVYRMKVADWVEDGAVAQFTLTCTDGTQTWTSRFSMTLHAPVLVVSDFQSVSNLAPGQDGVLVVSVQNTGSATAHNVRVELYSSSTDITFELMTQYLWTIPAGETATARYFFTVDSDVTMGSSYEVMYIVEAEQYMTQGSEFLNIGVLKETFETGDFSIFDWQTLGGEQWCIDNSTANSGTFSARSGVISDANLTTLQVSMNVTADGTISFFKKICSEANKDKLTFYIDNQILGVWSGEIDWSQETFNVTTGTHVFRWIYMKDSSGSYGSDACWIDDVQFPAVSVIEILPGPDLYATVDHGRVILSWQSLGSGFEYIVRCDGTYLATVNGTAYSETRIEGTYLYSVVACRQDRLTAPSYKLVNVGAFAVAEKTHSVRVYPNPTKGVVLVETNGDMTLPPLEYRIYNLMGQPIRAGKLLENNQIDLSDQAKGIYVLHLYHEGGVAVQKIVLQ